MISPIPGATITKPGTATRPLPGIIADVVTKEGKSCKPNEGGLLVIKHPWPSMLRTIFGDDERYTKTYWSEFPVKKIKGKTTGGYYFAGDGARKDKDGNFWIMGRVDDVVNVAGHRLGTAEIESALVSNHKVAEAAVVGHTAVDLHLRVFGMARGIDRCAEESFVANRDEHDEERDEREDIGAERIREARPRRIPIRTRAKCSSRSR
jgi:acyl-coenzyme A synthetase/AMP-(fatty) acid ligase